MKDTLLGNILASSYSTSATSISGTGTTTGQTIDAKTTFGNYLRAIPLEILVTAIGGTSPTMTVSVECSDTSGFSTVQQTISIPAITATGKYFIAVASKWRYMRVKNVAGGTSPTATIFLTPTMAHQ